MVWHPIDAGRLVLPHVHQHEVEYSYVFEGTIGARVGDQETVAGPGSYVIKPRGLMHSFWNAGPGPDLGGDFPGRFRELLQGTRGGGRSWPEAGVGNQVWGDLLIGLGRRPNL